MALIGKSNIGLNLFLQFDDGVQYGFGCGRAAGNVVIDLDDLVRIHRGAQMAVDQLEPAVWQFVDQERPGKANRLIQRGQRLALPLRVVQGPAPLWI